MFFESDLLGSPGIFPASSAFSFSFGVDALSESFSTGLWPVAGVAGPDVVGVVDVPMSVVAPVVDGAITVCIAVGVAVAVPVVGVKGTSITPLAV